MIDSINRQDAIRIVWKAYQHCMGLDLTDSKKLIAMVDCMQTTLATMPAAASRRGQTVGHWVPVTLEHSCTGEILEAGRGSECGADYLRHYGAKDGFDECQPNYCPNCGAYMKGEHDGKH